MQNLPVSNLNSWQKITSGTGTITVSNGGRSAIFNGVTGSGAQIQKNISLSPTGIYTLSFFARRIRGEGNAWITDGTTQNQMQVLSDSWERYEITGSAKILSSSLSSFIRINIGIATANDGSIEVSDVCMGEEMSSFGCLKTIAAGIINISGGVYTIGQNYGNITSVQLESPYILSVTCIPLNASVMTPSLHVTALDTQGTQTVGRIQPQFYDKATGKAMFRFLNDANSPVGIATINASFSFKAETI